MAAPAPSRGLLSELDVTKWLPAEPMRSRLAELVDAAAILDVLRKYGPPGQRWPELALLRQSLVHSSAKNEASLPLDNEVLEFLGDSIVGAAVSALICSRFPGRSEKDLTRLRARLVSTEALGALAEKMGLGALLRVGTGEKLSDSARLRGSAFEAFVGALYLTLAMGDADDAAATAARPASAAAAGTTAAGDDGDASRLTKEFAGVSVRAGGSGGDAPARASTPSVSLSGRAFAGVLRFVAAAIDAHEPPLERLLGAVDDHKSVLQELIQALTRELPVYKLLGEAGGVPSNGLLFTATVSSGETGTLLGTGQARDKKSAQQEAARQACAVLRVPTAPHETNFKGRLNEHFQKTLSKLPVYADAENRVADRFVVGVYMPGGKEPLGRGTGATKAAAETEAAKAAVQKLRGTLLPVEGGAAGSGSGGGGGDVR